jgi:hypothetical protein
MNLTDEPVGLATYEIVVRGEFGERWSNWLLGLAQATAVREGSTQRTVLTVQVRDQAALRGILNHLWDLNLTLIGVRRIETHPDEGG